MAAKSEAAFKLVDVNLDEMKVKILPTINSTSDHNDQQAVGAVATTVAARYKTLTTTASSQKKAMIIGEYTDPPLSQFKGRQKRPQRLKPLIEKLPPKRRTCSYCNEQAGHNFRSCPKVCSKQE
jgi:hypothetical protein